jgi:hypothetical protein
VERSKNGRHKMLDRNNWKGRLLWKPRIILTLATHILVACGMNYSPIGYGLWMVRCYEKITNLLISKRMGTG